jgi:hypothetical protein
VQLSSAARTSCKSTVIEAYFRVRGFVSKGPGRLRETSQSRRLSRSARVSASCQGGGEFIPHSLSLYILDSLPPRNDHKNRRLNKYVQT